MESKFAITASEEAGKVPVTVFHIHGDIDTNTYQQLEEMASKAHEGGTRNLLLDLSEVDFVSSAGLRAFHKIYTMLRQASKDESDEAISRGLMDGTYKSPHLKLLKPSMVVQTAMKTAGFDMYIEWFDDHGKALAAFG
jgi:anti-anti-sigma factor